MYRGFEVVQHLGETAFYVFLDGGEGGSGSLADRRCTLDISDCSICIEALRMTQYIPQCKLTSDSVKAEGSLGADLILWHRNATDL